MAVLYIYIYLYYYICSAPYSRESHHCLFKGFRPISLRWLADKCNLTTNILFLIMCFIIDAFLELLRLILTKCPCMRFSQFFTIYSKTNATISKDVAVFYRFLISFQLWNWITFIFPLHYQEKCPLEHAFCIRTGNMRIPIQDLLNKIVFIYFFDLYTNIAVILWYIIKHYYLQQ